jgi:predicted branched-subunit amino acid permease
MTTFETRSADRPLAPATEPARTPGPLRMAAEDALAVAAGIIAFGLALGVTIVTLGSSRLAGLFGAGAVYGGSAQLTAVTLLAQGGSIAATTLTAAIVNFRLLLYSATLAPRFRKHPTWFRWLAPHFIIDQTFLMSTTRLELSGTRFRRYWVWLGGVVLVIWTGSVTLGVVVGPLLPRMPHLGLVGTALFIGLLVPRLTSRPAVLGAVVSGLAAALVSAVAPSLAIIAGALCGVAAATTANRGARTQHAVDQAGADVR